MKHHLKHIRKGTPITVEIHKPHNRFGNEKKALPDNAGAYYKAHRKKEEEPLPNQPGKSFSPTKPYRNQRHGGRYHSPLHVRGLTGHNRLYTALPIMGWEGLLH